VILKQPACQAPLSILNQGSSSRGVGHHQRQWRLHRADWICKQFVVDVGRSYRCLN